MKNTIIAPSLIPGAGMGLYAGEHIRRGEQIVMVTGERYPSGSDMISEDNLYLLDTGDGTNDCIDVTGPAMYANDACGLSRIEGLVNNAIFRVQEDGSLWLEATRTIREGAEIFASYGRAYWASIKSLHKSKLAQQAIC
jgi:SET domain-containing protein